MFHIVDDEKMVRDIFLQIFLSFEFKALAFGSPFEYFKYMNRDDYQSPIAIFSDVQMPDMSGYDFMHQIRQIHSTQKFVILSGSPEIEHIRKNLACMYLCKPFTADSLKEAINLLIQCDKRCETEKMEITFNDDRSLFDIKEWTCPNDMCTASPKKSDCFRLKKTFRQRKRAL
ncbi:MAG: response regulator [Mariprofundaceae bacterium]